MRRRVAQVLAGNLRAAAQLMRDLDDRLPAAVVEFKEIYGHTGAAYLVGITGGAGAGKSTVVSALISLYRRRRLRVGVVAIDPSSPRSGGAILGDRIRMQRHALDEGVFIRSLATRGHLGGLSRSAFDVAMVLDAMGYERVLIETVGAGQDEVEIAGAAHTTVVVTAPGLGDDVQAIKAGLLEIADVLVVNKADRDGADRTVADLTQMLELRGGDALGAIDIIQTVATATEAADSGLEGLDAAIERHRQRVGSGTGHTERSRRRAAAYIAELVRAMLADRASDALCRGRGLEEFAGRVAERTCDPYSAAEAIVAAL